MKNIKFTVNGREVTYVRDPRFNLIDFLQILGLRADHVIVLSATIKPIDVLGCFSPIEVANSEP